MKKRRHKLLKMPPPISTECTLFTLTTSVTLSQPESFSLIEPVGD